MRRILHPALVLASAVAVATCADAPTGPRNARNGGLLHGRVAVAAQLTRTASETAARLTQFGFAIDNVGITLRRVPSGTVVLDTTIAVTPGQTLSLALPVTVTTVDEQFVARVEMRQGTTVLYSGEHQVGATLDGATTAPPPVVIEVEYAGPGASATSIRITPRDSVFPTTARPQFGITATDAAGAAVANVPIVWSTSDAAMAAVDPTTGVVTPGNRRGAVTLRALSLSGLTDTLPLVLLSPATSVATASGAGQTGTAGRALAAPLVVQVLAADGLPAAGESVTFAAMGTGSITPATATTDDNGRASASIVLGAQLGDQQFTATVQGLPPVTAVQHATAGAPARITRVSSDTLHGVAGAALDTLLAVRVEDEFGLPVSAATVQWTVAGAGGTLAAASSATATDGTASIGFTFGTAAGPSTVTATAGDAGVSFTLVAAAGTATRLTAVSGDAQQAAPSTALAPFVVRLADQHGNPIAGQGVTWTRTAGSGSLSASSTTTAADGSASVTYTTGTTAGADRVVAAAAGLEVAFTATTRPGAPATLVRVAGDAQTVTAGTVIPTRLAARVTDAAGNGTASVVDISVGGPGGTTVTETGIATDTAGNVLVPLTLLERPRAAGTYTAVVRLQDAPATQVTFTITVVPAPAAVITVVDAPTHAKSDSLLVPQPAVQLLDSLGNGSHTADVAITATATGGATLSGTPTATTDSTGRAVFSGLALHGSGTATIAFAATGLTAASHDVTVAAAPVAPPAPAFTVTRSGPEQLRISQFHDSIGGFGVVVRDSAGAPVSGVDVHFALAGDGSHGSFTGGGFALVVQTDGSGTAHFNGWSPPAANGSYVLTAQAHSGGTSVGSSLAFVAVRSTWAYDLSVAPASPIAGSTAEVSAALVDGAGVPVTESGRTLTWTSSATLGAVTSQTDADGIARVSVTTPPAPGTITVSATDVPGVAGALEFASRTAGGSVTVTPQRDTLTSIGDTRQLTATMLDSAGAPVTGTFTWTSRNPVSVTVDGSGLATAVAVGASYVVATDIGGISDSALVVVQQRVATVMVTPATTTIRLTGRQQFTAAAVDGRGHPIGSPTFTWVSTVPSIAMVDSTGSAEGLSLGSTEIRATAGGVTGVATLTVVTPITRIAVGVDSSGVPVTNAAALPSLGDSRRYIAVAYDTLDQPMTGVAFAWATSNASVAQLDSVAATSAYARAAANGTTNIRATAQGVTGSAVLTVQQVLATIQLTPASATIGVNGTIGTIARGVDANGFYISGGGYAFTSSNPGVATVGSTSGTVTGVSLGTTTITATAGSITSNGAVVTVSASVPPVISFGRDTLSVGRGSSTSIPVFLSTPHSSPVTVQLSVADTFAYFNPATVTFNTGQTAVNANLVGRNAGTTRVHAVDASSTGFAGDTAVLSVQATLRLASTNFSMNATDSRSTQVLLSDPSPPGGTYVVLDFGTAGVASASPNPAFIPEGQLAADVVITGTAGSASTTTTSIVPSAIGVNGTSSSVTVYPATLTLSHGAIRMGAGQHTDSPYAYVSANHSTGITLTLASSDTTIATVPASVTIPAGGYYQSFRVSARAPGTATISVSSPGWTAASQIAVTVTSPRVVLCCATSMTTTAPAYHTTIYTTDSLGSASVRTNALVVRMVSRDTTVLRVLDSTVTVAPGQYYTSAGRVAPGGAVGSTYLYIEAGGHRADSVLFTVNGPQLQWSHSLLRIGTGQVDGYLYAYAPHNVLAPLALTITSSDSSIAAPQTDATIAAGSNYQYITVRAMGPGTATLTVTAPGYSPATMTYVSTTPRLVLSGGGTVNAFGPPRNVTTYVTDSLGSAHNRQTALTVSYTSTDTTVIALDSTAAVVPGGAYYTGVAVRIAGPGTARVVATADGHRPDSVTFTVVSPQLQFSSSGFMLGARQYADAYVSTPDYRSSELPVTFTRTNGAAVAMDSSATIPSGTYYRYFTIRALEAGIDTVIASAPGYRPDTLLVRVTTPKLTAGGLPSGRTTTSPPFITTVYATDSLGSSHLVSDTVVVELISSDTTVIRPAARYVTILPGAYYTQWSVDIVGPGTATLTYADTAGRYLPYTTGAMTVTGPSLGMSSNSYQLGMGQTTGSYGVYVHVPNAVAEPLTINLTSTSTRVATVPATVTIPAGVSYAYFQITAGDTVGTIQVQATATGYTPTAMTVQVTVPKFVISTSNSAYSTTGARNITVYATNANGSAQYVREDVIVTLASSAPGVASVDSVTVTIPAGQYHHSGATWTPEAEGTAQLSASDARAVYHKYTTATANLAVTRPPVYISNAPSALGIGQYTDQPYVSTPDAQEGATTVTFSHLGTARTLAPATVTIPGGSYYAYFRLTGVSAGTDTLVAAIASPAHRPDTTHTIVGSGRIDPVSNWPATLAVGDSVQLTFYVRDPHQNIRNVVSATTWSLSHNANIEFRQGDAVVTSVTIPADGDRVTLYVKALSAGTGTAAFTASNYSTYNNSITVTP